MRLISNFIDDSELTEFQKAIKSGNWHWGQRSNNNTLYPMWYQPYFGKGEWNKSAPEVVKTVARRFLDLLPRGSQLQRAMLAGNTFGQDGDIHRDWQEDGCETMIIYVNNTWDIHWGGETIIYSKDLEIVNTIQVKPKRAVLFDSNLPHIGKDPARRCGELRVVLALQAKLSK